MRFQYILFAIALLPAVARAEASTEPAAPAEATEVKKWDFSLSINSYFVRDDQDFIQPTFTVDHDWLHLEARYNYEDMNTTSLWAGYNFSFGEDLTLDLTPMIGGVFGDTNGIAPGYKFSLAWRKLELYSEAEFLFDTDSNRDSYFYAWTELTYSPVDWLRAGLVFDRTRAYKSDQEIQHGLLVAVPIKNFDIALYLFNPEDHPFVMLGFRVDF